MIGVVFMTVVTGSVISVVIVGTAVVPIVVVAEGVANEPAGTAADENAVFVPPVIASSPMLE
jgi:hypothetical protein